MRLQLLVGAEVWITNSTGLSTAALAERRRVDREGAARPAMRGSFGPQLARRSPAACARARPSLQPREGHVDLRHRRAAGDRRSTRSTSGMLCADLLELLRVAARCSRASSPRARCRCRGSTPRSSIGASSDLSGMKSSTPTPATDQRQRRTTSGGVAALAASSAPVAAASSAVEARARCAL